MIPFFILLGVVVLLAVVPVVWTRRRFVFQRWAASRDWEYDEFTDRSFQVRHPFRILRRGYNRRLLRRADGTEKRVRITAFDYHYAFSGSPGQRDEQEHHVFSALMCRARGPGLLPLLIEPVGSSLQDERAPFDQVVPIDFPGFGDRFVVRGADSSWVAKILDAEILDKLSEHSDIGVEMGDEGMLLFHDRPWSPADLERAIGLGAYLLPAILARARTPQC